MQQKVSAGDQPKPSMPGHEPIQEPPNPQAPPEIPPQEPPPGDTQPPAEIPPRTPAEDPGVPRPAQQPPVSVAS
jgi:hypothetical protein